MSRQDLFTLLALLPVLTLGCGPSEDAKTAASAFRCEDPQPVVTDIRWLGPAQSPGKPPLGGLPAEVGKPFAVEQNVSVKAVQVDYTPISDDQNAARALLEITHASETKEIRLARRLPGGPVCYKEIAGVWVGLVETVPNKAMVRIGLPPAPPPEKAPAPPAKK